MITVEQLVAESEALVKLLNDPRFADQKSQNLIVSVINELAWVNDGEAMPESQMLVLGWIS